MIISINEVPPETEQTLDTADIYAHHVEAHNAAFRRRMNTYAKTKQGLQRTLDVHPVFVHPHWTTGNEPAVALGIIKGTLCLEVILTERFA